MMKDGITFDSGHAKTQHPDASAFERHCHPWTEVLYVLQGQGRMVLGQEEYPLISGILAVIPAGTYHYVAPSSDSCYERRIISFYSLGTATDFSDYKVFDLTGDTFLKDCLASMENAEEDYAKAIFTAVLLRLKCSGTPAMTLSESGVCADVLRYIEENPEKLNLDELAKKLHRNKYYMCHEFSEYMGISIYAYDRTRRMALAKKWIAEGQSPTKIWEKLGYSDYSVFYKAFKKQYGISPKEGADNK